MSLKAEGYDQVDQRKLVVLRDHRFDWGQVVEREPKSQLAFAMIEEGCLARE
jgi:hypothetical protein